MPPDAIAVASERSAASDRPGLDETSVPLPEAFGIDAVVERVEPEPRRLIARVARDEDEPVREREPAVGLVEVRQEVGHRDEHGEPRAPAIPPVARAEVEPDLHDVGRRHTGLEQSEDGLRDDEREPVFETLLQPATQVRDGVAGVTRASTSTSSPSMVDVEAARVVGERIERAAAREVEAGVVPVTRDQTALHRALVQREAHVRAAVLDRVRRGLRPRRPPPGSDPTLVSSCPDLRSSSNDPACTLMLPPHRATVE